MCVCVCVCVSVYSFHLVEPCFSTCFVTWNPKKATEISEEPLLVYIKLNIKWNMSICLYFMYIMYKISNDVPLKFIVTSLCILMTFEEVEN